MSQRCVEHVIGRLATDEAFRRRFAESPDAVLDEACCSGAGLTAAERTVLKSIDPEVVARFADALDPRIQKIDLGATTCRD